MKPASRTSVLSVLAVLATVFFAPAGFAADRDKDFKPLFNGKDLTGWQIVHPDKSRWKVTPDKLLVNPWSKRQPSSDLISEKKFKNFTLRFDYLINEGGNSGVYLRGRHEIQLLDDDGPQDRSIISNGAIYNQVAPSVFASRPGGAWQTIEATIIGNQITVILNGKKIHDRVVCTKPTGQALDSNINAPGPILLQGRLGDVKFRDILIKELPE
ncbi:3-keto-disaccharide hydrolase [Brevifollis gellanilyticus]|uniref:3-keto-alpha-glucoside-1,2-lyase/3-keto-2-hydroxy-glucal hydratase domain-containing protein n=1 Tax=Brevifollis gellanilyticus TaxID=748831 RepID=A0A512M9S1_9BACT|nr:DUF1080 domain-containing protein [Brevifollis gellanilyticus]GEP43484.1 hypothetical protein BGE01nite_27750 [Brevifollis gellanilyticus]